jgi:hypothetical protein
LTDKAGTIVVKIIRTASRESDTVTELHAERPKTSADGGVASLWDALSLVPLLCGGPLVNFDRRRELTALVMPSLIPLSSLHETTRDCRVFLTVVSQLVRVSTSVARPWCRTGLISVCACMLRLCPARADAVALVRLSHCDATSACLARRCYESGGMSATSMAM